PPTASPPAYASWTTSWARSDAPSTSTRTPTTTPTSPRWAAAAAAWPAASSRPGRSSLAQDGGVQGVLAEERRPHLGRHVPLGHLQDVTARRVQRLLGAAARQLPQGPVAHEPQLRPLAQQGLARVGLQGAVG